MIIAPPGAPGWAADMAAQMNRELQALTSPSAPGRSYAVNSASDLARLPPQANVERIVFVRDIARLAVSTGTAWLRSDTGAQIAP